MGLPAYIRNRSAVMWLTITALIMVTTVVLFYVLKTENVTNTYWLAMWDFLLMEFIAGWGCISSGFAGEKGDSDPTPTAMRISISSTLLLFLIFGAILSLTIAVLSGHTSKYDTAFKVILVLKWLGLLVVTAAMRSAGAEGADTRLVREVSRKKRTSFLSLLQRNLNDLKDMPLAGMPAQGRRRVVVDHLEMTCNQVRSWVSGTPEAEDTNSKIESLTNELVQLVSSIRSASEDKYDGLFAKVEQISRDISFEVKNTGRRSAAGIS